MNWINKTNPLKITVDEAYLWKIEDVLRLWEEIEFPIGIIGNNEKQPES